jgi:hypothetical protein
MLEVEEVVGTTTSAFNIVRSTQAAPTTTLAEYIGEKLADVSEVEAVYGARDGNVLHIYTVVDAFDGAVRRKIYEKEAALIEHLLSDLAFDFNIISRRGRDLSEVIHESELVVCYRR